MSINSGILKIVKLMESRGVSEIGITDAVWEKLDEVTKTDFTGNDCIQLLAEACIVRVGNVLRSYKYREATERSVTISQAVGNNHSKSSFTPSPPTRVHFDIEVTERPRTSMEISLSILDTVSRDVGGGKRHTMRQFGVADCSYKKEKLMAGMQGYARWHSFYDYVEERLKVTGKRTVDELGEGEQTKIARMLAVLEEQGEPLEISHKEETKQLKK